MSECRMITFFNFHIPLAKDIVDTNIPYLSMGFFDGMLTQKVVLKSQDKKYNEELTALWEYELQRTAESQGKYSYQNIACFEPNLNNTNISDEELWCEKTDKQYPLTFVTFLQLKNYVHGQNALDKLCLEFNKKVESIIQCGKYYTYKTVDKNDFVVCIKCRNYKKAVEAIKQLHQIDSHKIIYSYTVFSVSKKVLDTLCKEEYPDIYAESINSICLKGIANSCGNESDVSLDTKYRKFGKQLLDRIYADEKDPLKRDARIYDILGDNDFRLIARNVKLGKILHEFGSGGLLDYYGTSFPSYLFSSSLLLNTYEKNVQETADEDSPFNPAKITAKVYETPICDNLEERIPWIKGVVTGQSERDEPYWATIAAMCNGIWQLLQSLKALERPDTKKYDFITIFVPLQQMVNILEDKIKKNEKVLILENRAEIFDFLHKISMTLHGTLRTDIQFFQIRDFNAVIHYSPSKLRAFYSLWALQLSDYYSLFCDTSLKKTYSFILSPGTFPEVAVKQLFDNDKDTQRLMLISLPERQLYTVKKLSIMLGHEVSHFVGTDVKCRYERYIALIKIIARIMTLEINKLRYENTFSTYQVNMENWIADSKIYDRIKKLLLAENALFENKGQLPEVLHSEITITCIMDIFTSFLMKYTELIVGEDCEYYYQSFINTYFNPEEETKKKTQVINEAKRISYAKEADMRIMIKRYSGNLNSFLIQILYRVLREACADINSILTLELTPEEYLFSFCNPEMTDKTPENQPDILTEKEIRISLVINSIKEGIVNQSEDSINGNFLDTWNAFNIKNFTLNQQHNSEAEILGYKIFLCFDLIKDKISSIKLYQSAYNYSKEYFIAENIDFYTDIEIWNEMNNYITSCVEEYLQKLSNNNNPVQSTLLESRQALITTFNMIASGSVGIQIQAIEDFLADYEEHFNNKPKKS